MTVTVTLSLDPKTLAWLDKAAERLEKQLREGVPLGTAEGERVEAYEDDPNAPEPPLRKRLRELEEALRSLWRAAELTRAAKPGLEPWDELCDALGKAEEVLGMPAEDQGDASEVEKARAIHAQHPTSAISTDGTPTTIRDVLEQATGRRIEDEPCQETVPPPASGSSE